MLLYVVHMLRWGDEEGHSYVEGVYTTKEAAEKHGAAEEEHRSGKYEPKIYTFTLDKPRKEKYMTDEQLQNMYAEAAAKVRLEHPEWFNKDGSINLGNGEHEET